MNYIAVLDTETNYDDEVMSIGVVIADAGRMEPLDTRYFVIHPAYQRPAMYAFVLAEKEPDALVSYPAAIELVREFLGAYGVSRVFAYNARFDFGHLSELQNYRWYDIMRLAAYRQYNHAIPANADCCASGKLRRGYRAEDVYRMLSGKLYREVHNALCDALDELEIMRMLGHPCERYEIGKI